ncbi:alpha-galactosidase [Mangrovactinospora gilvigrisea]|uniref:Alpha-galactosidase n=1 Tax=Mangrovactinospora gilvigrisea TaxID=1428644 RepID=A0A1J7CF75_9ACTN|nr:NPCBM/NEW2 domain-containing protein [Mangrovactinospora gilvigrisea]OIV38354.1 alpha-galactosidase [Mangrovactinospora gilvigrisea]
MAAAGLAAAGTAAAPPAAALDNGLARTPPMGYNDWNALGCGSSFNESTMKQIADIIVDKGLAADGYRYVNLDDCWAETQRNADGKLVPDPNRFPDGISGMADYVHAKGLKLGIYTSAGTHTCNPNGFPGALGHEQSDADQFASWGVDYLKYDNCNNQGVDAVQRYTAMRDALAATGRPIVYSLCEWGQNKPWLWAKDVGNLWRTTGDISDNWASMLSRFESNVQLAQYAGPGHWNDPDMLEVGNGGMTDTEYRSHFSLWSIMASPLLIGTDLRKASQATLDILGNKDVIAVDQDRLGRQGTVLKDGTADGSWVIVKPMADGSRAVALFNSSSTPRSIGTSAAAAGLPARGGYTLRDLWQHKDYSTAGAVRATVPAHGTVMYRVSADPHWASHPPAVAGGTTGSPLVPVGGTGPLGFTATDLGRTPAREVRVSATVSASGWALKPNGPTAAKELTTGQALGTHWTLTPAPGGTSGDTATVTWTLSYRAPDGTPVSSSLDEAVQLVQPPPSGDSYVSDLPFVSATNDWGPVERDTSNGEAAAGDGHTITVDGTKFTKGLGTNAPSDVQIYTGGRCTRLTAQVGVDDEVTQGGSVTFEVHADGAKVYDSGLRLLHQPPVAVSADVTGAQVVDLVVTDGGDGPDYDHADWGDAVVHCE